MVTIKEDTQDITFASSFLFEETEQIRDSLDECTNQECRILAKYLLRQMEIAHGKVEQAYEGMAKSLGWS